MPNIAAVLKAEISRLAKKEAKVATSKLKRASVQISQQHRPTKEV